jgi:Domain of unknown function (DUF1818)
MRVLRSGPGWRVGWDSTAPHYQALLGTDYWSIELTAAEWADFRQLAAQLAATMLAMERELMDEETITCAAETARLWIEVEGFPQTYSLRFILQSGRQAEGAWDSAAVPELLAALQAWDGLGPIAQVF